MKYEVAAVFKANLKDNYLNEIIEKNIFVIMRHARKLFLTFLIFYMSGLLRLLYRMRYLDDIAPLLGKSPHLVVLNQGVRGLDRDSPHLGDINQDIQGLTDDAPQTADSAEAIQANYTNMVVSFIKTRVLIKDAVSYKAALTNDPEEMLGVLNYFSSNMSHLFNYTINELQSVQGNTGFQASALPDYKKMKIRFKHIILQANLRKLQGYIDQDENLKQSHALGEQIQKNIQKLQSPRNCRTARKLLCEVCSGASFCGFACTVSQISYCLAMAYLSNRTMIMKCESWRYSEKGWDAAFLPITNCSTKHIGPAAKGFQPGDLHWVFDPGTETVSIRHPVEAARPTQKILPPVVPGDLVNKVFDFNNDPPSWWVGQFKVWAMRMKKDVAREVKKYIDSLGIDGTIVGLHVRRTDKTSEAAYHPLHEYMTYVEEWYDAHELLHPGTKRRVYLATDESSLINEAIHTYPTYEFIHDKNISITAAYKSRYNEISLKGIIKDIYSLLHCDYVVCTFSSQVCRLVYELSQTTYGDTHSFQSLDDIYFIVGQSVQQGWATEDHKKVRPGELNVRKGDMLIIHGNHWDGYLLASHSKGDNPRNSGFVPAFKIECIVRTHNISSKILW